MLTADGAVPSSQLLPSRLPLWLLRGPRQGVQLYLHGHRPLSEKISGPLLDRIDIHVEVPRVDYEKLADKRQVENSKTIRARVQAARERQLERFQGTKLTCNAEMGPAEVREFCQPDASGEKLLKAAVQQLHLSARAYHRVLRLARTIADLAGSEMIMANHVAEAVQYRPRVGI